MQRHYTDIEQCDIIPWGQLQLRISVLRFVYLRSGILHLFGGIATSFARSLSHVHQQQQQVAPMSFFPVLST